MDLFRRMNAVCLHDKNEIEAILRRNAGLHLYSLADLDEFFWPHTTWYGFAGKLAGEAIVLMYTGEQLPVLLALTGEGGEAALKALLEEISPILPRRFYAHLNGPAVETLGREYEIHSHGMHLKMTLKDSRRLQEVDTSRAKPLTPDDRVALEELYAQSYPGNWFQPRMLETGCYFGIWEVGKLVSVAGIHAASRRYRVAALGNITTHPAYRGRGLGRVVTARLCLELLGTTDLIGLNVKADNAAAIACYQHLGFETIATYEESTLHSKA